MNVSQIRALWAASLGLLVVCSANADGGRAMPRTVPSVYTQECASCHVPYPPGMLPARSWQRVMSGLEQHYGTDASLDARTAQDISAWLQTHAGTYKRVTEPPPQDRITRSAWFERKHREIDAAIWRLPSVKSAANCAACHVGAEQGQFDEDNLRLPAGLTPRQRGLWRD